MNEEIKLIITDFDGTLVDTFEANLLRLPTSERSVLSSINTTTYAVGL